MNFYTRWRLARLKVKRTGIERTIKMVRSVPGKTTVMTIESMDKLNQRLIEVLIEIKKLEDAQ